MQESHQIQAGPTS